MEPTINSVSSDTQKYPNSKWLIPLSITGLVILVSAITSGLTYVLVSNNNTYVKYKDN